MREYLTRAAAWFSQGINCLLLGGHHDQTVSARAYVNRHRFGWGVAYRIINLLFFWRDNHCRESHSADVEFAKEVLNA